MALKDYHKYYYDEMMQCEKRIADLKEKQNWLGVALGKLDPIDRYILELRYMGSQKDRRHPGREPTWKEIADKVNYSESRVKQVAGASLLRLAMTSDQIVFPGMVR